MAEHEALLREAADSYDWQRAASLLQALFFEGLGFRVRV